MKYSKIIKSFCDTDKCEYFSYEQQYDCDLSYNHKPSGKIYYCSHPNFLGKNTDNFARKILVTPKCPWTNQ